MEQHVRLLALCRVKGVDWRFIAREAQKPDGLDRIYRGESSESSEDAQKTFRALEEAAGDLHKHQESIAGIVDQSAKAGHQLTTVLPGDQDYPATLRAIFNLPPFLFYRGEFRPIDARSVAVVGSRKASDDGLKRARQLARMLVEHSVTVVSGLARGIDTAAHQGAIAGNGRTIAVLGSGLNMVYPEENVELARDIEHSGVVVSQFFPDTPPHAYNFPRRNVVTSGISQGTCVVEATQTSGAKMQARLALQHGKRVFLMKSLVDQMPWASGYIKRGAISVESVGDVVRHLRAPESIVADARHAQIGLFDEF